MQPRETDAVYLGPAEEAGALHVCGVQRVGGQRRVRWKEREESWESEPGASSEALNAILSRSGFSRHTAAFNGLAECDKIGYSSTEPAL